MGISVTVVTNGVHLTRYGTFVGRGRPYKAMPKITPTPDRYASSPEATLLKRCLDGNRGAWDEFVVRFSPLIFSVVHKTLRRHELRRDETLVDDLFHQSFLALYDNDYKKLRQWSQRCSVASWVRLVTSSVVIDALRRRRPHLSWEAMQEGGSAPTEPALDGTALELLLRAERVVALRRALAALGTSDRALLHRLFLDQQAPAEVAMELQIKPGALYTRKNRALERLRDIMRRSQSDGAKSGTA